MTRIKHSSISHRNNEIREHPAELMLVRSREMRYDIEKKEGHWRSWERV